MRQTSLEAYWSIKDDLNRLEKLVLDGINGGSTCDELEQTLGLSHQTVSARLRGLAQAGLIVDGGGRRPTRSNRKAIVWQKTF